MTKFSDELKSWLVATYELQPDSSDEDYKHWLVKAIGDGTITEDKVQELQGNTTYTVPTARDIFGGSKSGTVNVKAPSERYKDFSYRAKHAKTGEPVRNQKGQEVETISERTYARVGAFLKWRASVNGAGIQLNDHEKQMVGEMFDAKERWAGDYNGEYREDWSGTQVKALLSDNTSGGVNINPLWYDQAIITFPLLSGELFPFVDVVDVPRSNVVNSGSIANPTVTWGQTDGTAISLFNTASMVAALNTSIFNSMVAIEVGKNELQDSIVDVGRYLVEVVGNRWAAELDKVIATGDGTTQPQGIVNASGITTLGSIGGSLGPLTLGDLEQLYFGVPKQYRRPAFRCAFIASDTTYSRCRAIPVGTDDARRVLGENEGSYDALSSPFRVSNDMSNNNLIFGALSRYRFYRRQGQETRFETQGQTLALKNTVLLISYMRCGGRVMDTNAFAMTTNCPA